MSKSEMFKSAWKLAKSGAVRFGGSSKDYFAASLTIIYANAKANETYLLDIQTSNNRPAWCAKVTGLDKRWGFKRNFINGGGRWELADGVYNYGRGKGDSDYLLISNGQATDIDTDDIKLMFA